MFFHFGNKYPADGRGVGDSGARQTSEDDRGPDVDHRKSGAHPTYKDVGKSDDPSGNTALVHQFASQYKKRNGQQRVGVQPVEQFGRDDAQRVGGLSLIHI